MIEKGFVKNIEVKYSEMDYNLTLKPSALLNYLQDFASENAESLNFGYSYICLLYTSPSPRDRILPVKTQKALILAIPI